MVVAVLFALIGSVSVSAQRIEHYNSPLYSPKNYDPSTTTGSGLPEPLKKVGIEQRLNEQLPFEAKFKNADGELVNLGSFFGKERPVIIALVYYECPMLCNEVLNGLTGSLKAVSFDLGKDYDVVAISFDARENDKADLAKNKKQGYIERYGRPGTENGWHFLTGTQEEIDKVTKAVGFNYIYDEATNQFAHAGGVMIATPEGKLSRYLYGVDYAPKDLKFGIMESSQNKIGNPVDQLLLYCFHYDPSTGKYGLMIINVMRLAGVATLVGMFGMVLVFWRRNKKKSAEVQE
ncbi:MAG: SCO family protein [Pyrinomonadaceae bacterium]|nr:SCO family protein [Pyrinomonadaceae bacterium]